jgi:shikimate dehydrogenase
MSGYGLIGFPLSHSWSAKFFHEKFERENLHDSNYLLFPIDHLSDFPSLLLSHPELSGLNVTIPYKETIIPYLDELDIKAKEIGAVNTIKITRLNGKVYTKGYNTDEDGFILSDDFSGYSHAFVLGTGGASRAVTYALRKLGIPFTLVSRKVRNNHTIGYQDLQSIQLTRPVLIINATPLGMFPDILSFPDIPYDKLTAGDFLYDLIYNPEITGFLKKGIEKGARTRNGLKMLQIQAEKSFEIWKGDTEK